MALQSSGAISFNDINVEFARGSGTSLSLSQLYRGGSIVGTNNTNVPTSGAISLSNFYGASRRVSLSYTYAANTNYSYQAWDSATNVSGYVAGVTDYTINIPSTTSINGSGGYSALSFTGFSSGDRIYVNNSGTIAGYGGSGCTTFPGYLAGNPQVGGDAGGVALNFSPCNAAVYVTNSGTIAGGGGGGGNGDAQVVHFPYGYGYEYHSGSGGGGGGGAAGGPNGTAGNGGPVTSPVPRGPTNYYSNSTAGGAGSGITAGAKGYGSYGHIYSVQPNTYYRAGDGGAGGARGASGGNGLMTQYSGQDWGGPYTFANGATNFHPYVSGASISNYSTSFRSNGGAAGNAIQGTSKYGSPISNTGNIYGPQVA